MPWGEKHHNPAKNQLQMVKPSLNMQADTQMKGDRSTGVLGSRHHTIKIKANVHVVAKK